MTNYIPPTETRAALRGKRLGLEDMDLSPQGLADAAANQQDPDSIVYAGNS